MNWCWRCSSPEYWRWPGSIDRWWRRLQILGACDEEGAGAGGAAAGRRRESRRAGPVRASSAAAAGPGTERRASTRARGDGAPDDRTPGPRDHAHAARDPGDAPAGLPRVERAAVPRLRDRYGRDGVGATE